MSTDPALPDWENLPVDPHLADDLGYFLLELEVISTANDSEQLIILPKDDSLLRDDAFIVTRESDVCDLDDWA